MQQNSGKGKMGDSPAGSDFFTVGAPLHPVRGGYVRRPADDALYNTIVAGRYAHVIAPERSGKTSLFAATAARLRNHGYKIATLDLTQIAERDGGTDAGRWYYSIAYRLLRQLRLKIDLQDWWQDKSILSNRQRLVEFYVEVILQNIREPVVVFVDGIQAVERLPFKEHLLPSIRAAHNSRATEPDFERLGFVLAGECDPHSLVTDELLSPFRVSEAITLDDFSRADLDIFATELNLPPTEARVALDRVWHWTGGQPYLTQKLCRAVSRDGHGRDIEARVDAIVHHQLAGRSAPHNEPHINHIHNRIVGDRLDHEVMLNLYGRLRKGLDVEYEPDSRQQRKLLAVGLVKVTDDGRLAVRNRLYEAVFTARWANYNLPVHWRGPALVTMLVVALLAIPFWYTQLLPKPYIRILVSPTLPLEAVEEAWRNLRSFPGHADTADRLYLNRLQNRGRRATEHGQIERVAEFARALPDDAGVAEQLVAGFWDRMAQRAVRAQRRDEAIIATLEALAVATPVRRRIAAALLGEDYAQLIATLPSQNSGQLLFNNRDTLLTSAAGSRVSQWSLQNNRLVAREPWIISSLEVTPLVRRVVIDRQTTLSRVGLSVNVGHARLDDLRLKLIAPSGRTVELDFDTERSSANHETEFSAEQLAPLLGEPVAGTWSLSLRDEATGINGHLLGWNLNLNSQVLVENFDRGLDIPAPFERESDNVWFDKNGRYAVARASGSDSARLWDLVSARPARTFAMPADERVVGIAAEARYLVTVAGDSVHIWRTANGRRAAVLNTGAAGGQVEISGDGRHLFVVRRGEPETALQLWSIDSATRLAELHIAGSPALLAIDDDGQYLAVADYDRAVRIWDFRSGTQLTQLDLHVQASELRMSADGRALAIAHGNQGISLWRMEQPAEPVLVERAEGLWQLRFSPSGGRLLAGTARRGFQVYRSADGARLGPLLDSGIDVQRDALLAFSADEQIVMTAAPDDRARFWHLPQMSEPAEADGATTTAGHRMWRGRGDALAAISPGGEHLAVADREGHVHIGRIDENSRTTRLVSDELNYVGHQGPVVRLAFSGTGDRVASVGADGSVRIWDVETGLPQSTHATVAAASMERMEFSRGGSYVAVLAGQRITIIATADGGVVADLALGTLHTSMAFAADDSLYLGAESGRLRRLAPDRAGNWNLDNVWQGSAPLRQLAASGSRPFLVIVDADNRAMLLDLQNGRLGAADIELPDRIEDMIVAPGNSRVLFRTARWIHRASIAASGLAWRDAIYAPNAMTGSRLVIERIATGDPEGGMLDPLGGQLLQLTRDAGFARVTELDFEYDDGPLLFGTRDELLLEWRSKLAMPHWPRTRQESAP